ncbi:MAG: hypothetical protein ACLRMJ_08460 [Alistipes finegoldii]
MAGFNKYLKDVGHGLQPALRQLMDLNLVGRRRRQRAHGGRRRPERIRPDGGSSAV